jgi:hypothetical protein
MTCHSCGAVKPDDQRFCSDCGNSLREEPVDVVVRREVERTLATRFSGESVVEVRLAQAVASKLSEWAKLFGFFVAIPLGLFAVLLSVLGFKTYTDFTSKVNAAREEALKPLENARAESKRIEQAYRDLGAKLEATTALASRTDALGSQLNALSDKVDKIAEVVRFKPSASLTPAIQQHLKEKLAGLHQYYESLGVKLAARPPSVSITTTGSPNGYYSPTSNEIVMHSKEVESGAGDAVAFLMYTHHVLSTLRGKGGRVGPSEQSLELGLADYLTCSFAERSDTIQASLKAMGSNDTSEDNRDVKHSHRLTELRATDDYATALRVGTLWAGAFWSLRESLGRNATDKLLLDAWRSANKQAFERDLKSFPDEILRQDGVLRSGRDAETIRTIFKARGLDL